jgi:hypothetical protein
MGFTLTGTPKARGFQLGWVGLCRLRLRVIIFGSVWFLSKTSNQTEKNNLKKKQNRVKPTGFGSVRFFREKTGLARFFRFWIGFFGYGLVFFVWLGFSIWIGFSGLARFWLGIFQDFFRFGSVFSVFCL